MINQNQMSFEYRIKELSITEKEKADLLKLYQKNPKAARKTVRKLDQGKASKQKAIEAKQPLLKTLTQKYIHFEFSTEQIPDIEPMLAKETKERPQLLEAAYTSDQWVAEEKFDGSRYIAHVLQKGIRLFSRHISKKDGNRVEKSHNIPQITHCTYKSLSGTILDGEVTIPGKDFGDVVRIMGTKDPQEALDKQLQLGYAVYNVFDILQHKGKDVKNLPLSQRRLLLEQVVKDLGNTYIKIVAQIKENKEEFYKKIVARQGEGLILKNINSPYVPGGRDSDKWIKAKKHRTYDVIVMGYEDPEEWSINVKNETVKNRNFARGWVANIVFGVYKEGKLTRIGSTSGMTEAVRKDVSDNKEKYLNTVIEVEGQMFFKEGIRHVQFLRFRPDANIKECTFEKLQGGEQ
jgi:ATP-dependent DNA ligase